MMPPMTGAPPMSPQMQPPMGGMPPMGAPTAMPPPAQPGLSPAPPPQLSPQTNALGIPDVTDQELSQHVEKRHGDISGLEAALKAEILHQAMLDIRYDHEWLQVMKEYKILPKDKAQAQVLIDAHEQHMMDKTDDEGNPVSDPIQANDDAAQEWQKRCIEIATRQKEKK